ncbi:hypothetical protein C8R48DRAFT_564590, partial [Suillus tomentosus]
DDNVGDNTKGLVDATVLLTSDEREELRNTIVLVQLALVKLRKLGFKIIHSTTKLLPAWNDILSELQMKPSMLPRDVSTCWNSTYDMLEYALNHRKVIDAVSQRRELGL